jgi:hypothetical protein
MLHQRSYPDSLLEVIFGRYFEFDNSDSKLSYDRRLFFADSFGSEAQFWTISVSYSIILVHILNTGLQNVLQLKLYTDTVSYLFALLH